MPNSPRPRPRPSVSGRPAGGRPQSARAQGDQTPRDRDGAPADDWRSSASNARSSGEAGTGRGRPVTGRYGAGREPGQNAPARYGASSGDASRLRAGSPGRAHNAGKSRRENEEMGRDSSARGGSQGGSGRSGVGRGDAGRSDARPESGRGRRDSAFDSHDRQRRPQTAAEKRSAEVKARRDQPNDTRPVSPAFVEAERWQPESWHDDGSIRDVAQEATARAQGRQYSGEAHSDKAPIRERRMGDPTRLDPSWVQEVERESDARTSARYMERLAAATEALERERYGDALRMVQSVLKNLPRVGAGHEVAGIALYRLGEWRKAAAELEQARTLHPAPEQLPVLADCYRALRRYREVDEIWREIRETSPAPAVMAEGRIVAAGALADQGDIAGALRLLIRVADAPKRVREYHLKQWYVIADLYDRSGDVVKARNFFKRVALVDSHFADVGDRLAMLGRR